MIGLCNPHNPFGVLYRPEDLEHIMALCEKYDLYIMDDEIWSDIVFPEEPYRNIYTLGNERCKRVMSVFGFSKSFGLAGLRIGCVYTTSEELFEKNRGELRCDDDGRVLRSSTIFIRDEKGHIIGSLCINQDLTDFIVASKLTQELTAFQRPSTEEEHAEEFFAHDISDVMEDMVRTELELLQKPVAYMQKEDKLALVQRMENKGIFDVKGAVEYVAERLGVTNYTIYNYLKAIRSAKR